MRRVLQLAGLGVVICAGLSAAPASSAEPPQSDAPNPLGLKVHHVTASVLDIERATNWYRDVLGFRVIDRGSRQNGAFQFAELEIPGFGVALVQIRPSPRASEPRSAAPLAAPSWIHIVFSVPDPDVTYQLLKLRGANVTTRSGTHTGPVTTFLIHDSEGNEIEIVAAAAH
jgi:catechol 2,3-dioxygenase-like lactoylglutathione lyase family enzyme